MDKTIAIPTILIQNAHRLEYLPAMTSTTVKDSWSTEACRKRGPSTNQLNAIASEVMGTTQNAPTPVW